MEIAVFKKHMVTECANCCELIVIDCNDVVLLSQKYRKHVDDNDNDECKRYHDALPTMADVTGILNK